MVNGQGSERGRALSPRVDVLWGKFKEVGMAVEGGQTDARVYFGHLLDNALFFLGCQGTGGVMENHFGMMEISRGAKRIVGAMEESDISNLKSSILPWVNGVYIVGIAVTQLSRLLPRHCYNNDHHFKAYCKGLICLIISTTRVINDHSMPRQLFTIHPGPSQL